MAILIFGLVPLTSAVIDQASDYEFAVPIDFAEFAQSSDEGLLATSEETIQEVKPVVEQVTEEVDIVEEEVIEEVSEVPEATEELVSEIVEEVTEEVVADESEIDGASEESSAIGGQDMTQEEGPNEGTDAEGDDEGQTGLDGDGVITRKIIYRADIGQAAFESGKIVVDVCIDRAGRILTVANNADSTTIENMDMVRDVLHLVADYRFENDYTAALRECGRISFIFDVDNGGEGWSDAVASYAASE